MNNNQQYIPSNPFETAVLFLIFNRFETTKQVFAAIRKAKPLKLYIAADGARPEQEGEAARVNAVRDYVTSNVDWDCHVKTLFSDKNLGCKYAISEAIDWFFAQEEMGIILEDDCLPSQSFFWYCEELLKKYQNDQRIFLISGYNKQNTWNPNINDYFFSSYGGIWGWASWRRAWDFYDLEMKDLKRFSDLGNFENLLGKKGGKIRKMALNSVDKKHINSWAYPWAFTRHKNGALACVPSKSLIKNIGFGADATHTYNIENDDVNHHEIQSHLRDNPFFVPDRKYDSHFVARKNIFIRIANRLRRKIRAN